MRSLWWTFIKHECGLAQCTVGETELIIGEADELGLGGLCRVTREGPVDHCVGWTLKGGASTPFEIGALSTTREADVRIALEVV